MVFAVTRAVNIQQLHHLCAALAAGGGGCDALRAVSHGRKRVNNRNLPYTLRK
jgi:hypothetical protein